MATGVPWAALARRVATPAIVLIIWQASVGAFRFGSGFIPTPSEAVQSLAIWIFGGTTGDRYSETWVASVEASFGRVISGFTVASVVGILVGMLIGRSRVLSDLVDPLVQALQPIPVSASVPFSLVFFGSAPGAAIVLVARPPRPSVAA